MHLPPLCFFVPPRRFLSACVILAISQLALSAGEADLKVNDRGYFEARGLNVLVFSNTYDGLFSDAKISGVELIHHETRTATNGDVRLQSTPGQWDAAPVLGPRQIDAKAGVIEAQLSYPSHNFSYTVRSEALDDGIVLSVILDKALPADLEGKAGFNLEFLPSAYFHKNYLADGRSGIFPLHPSSQMMQDKEGKLNPAPLISGNKLVLAPEDPLRRVIIESHTGPLSLFDGRNQAQNGWFVVRSLIPAGKTGCVISWTLRANRITGWLRAPVIGHSQVGYHPGLSKVALIELDRNDTQEMKARLLRVTESGELKEVLAAVPADAGTYLRYNYKRFDFSAVRDPGLYVLEYGETRTKAFPIANDVYASIWQPTLDVYLPVQMDHMFVREAYRVWHGDPHKDDARQAPVNHEHFDLYAQGPTTDTPYKPGEHIPGLNVGGWFDAGDFDIRTQTQYALIQTLVHTWEDFGIKRDQTRIDEKTRHVDMHTPDGTPDILQQIEHGTLALIAQHRAVGHAIHGIIEPTLGQYTHLGDASTKTDNLVFDPAFKQGEEDGKHSGMPDDRWAFTSKSSALNYGSAAGLAAASRALRGYRDALAEECLTTAKRVWSEEHSHAPDLFHSGNTTGGELNSEEFNAAVELLLSTGDSSYAKRVNELLPVVADKFAWNGRSMIRALRVMDADYRQRVFSYAQKYTAMQKTFSKDNPYGVPIMRTGWAGSGLVVHVANMQYALHKAFPDTFPSGPVFDGLEFLMGRHPGSDLSLVSGVGALSKEVAYGNNRADFSFIAGGIVPGVLILKPDFPENKEDWPFLWGENEYVVNLAGSYLYLAHAAAELAGEK